MTLMKIFISPGQTILNGSGFDKTILVCMNQLHNDSLKSISKQFSQQLESTIQERDGSEVICGSSTIFLGNQSNEATIDTLQTEIPFMELQTKVIEVFLYNRS
jgi:hypothetical protein